MGQRQGQEIAVEVSDMKEDSVWVGIFVGALFLIFMILLLGSANVTESVLFALIIAVGSVAVYIVYVFIVLIWIIVSYFWTEIRLRGGISSWWSFFKRPDILADPTEIDDIISDILSVMNSRDYCMARRWNPTRPSKYAVWIRGKKNKVVLKLLLGGKMK